MTFRIDRFLTMFLFYPVRKMLKESDGVRIPILMYHSISDDSDENVHPYYQTNTLPERFEEHLQFLHKNRYSVTSLREAVKRLEQKSSRSSVEKNEKSVVLTFDDGYADFHTHAFPLLQKYGFTATVFLPTGIIDHKVKGLRGKNHLSWKNVAELHDNGIEFGSHTVTHSLLRTKNDDELDFELRKSKREIEEVICLPVNAFSYPYAFPEEDTKFVALLKETLRNCGYKYGVSTRLGTASRIDDIFCLKRIPVNTQDDRTLFEAKLNHGYDWLGTVQYLYKKIKNRSYFNGMFF